MPTQLRIFLIQRALYTVIRGRIKFFKYQAVLRNRRQNRNWNSQNRINLTQEEPEPEPYPCSRFRFRFLLHKKYQTKSTLTGHWLTHP